MRRGRREDEKRQRDDLGKIERDWSKYSSRVEGVKVEDWGGESAESCENRENMKKYITKRKEGVCKETESMEDGENRMLELVRGWKENGM
jgi:hypothetical protein